MPEFENQGKVLPALSQSRFGDMACETLYVYKHARYELIADSEAAARGIEIHETLATYINHLVNTRRSTDVEVFDGLMRLHGDGLQLIIGKHSPAFRPSAGRLNYLQLW